MIKALVEKEDNSQQFSNLSELKKKNTFLIGVLH